MVFGLLLSTDDGSSVAFMRWKMKQNFTTFLVERLELAHDRPRYELERSGVINATSKFAQF